MATLAKTHTALPTNSLTTEDSDNNAEDSHLLPMPLLAVAVVFISVAIITAVGGNLLVILSYGRDQGLRNVHNLYLLHLAVSDLTIGACSMPFYFVYTVQNFTWPLGVALCKFFLAEDSTMCCMSTLVVILVAADRMNLLTKGARYQVVETRTRAYVKLAICWICAFLLYSPAILLWDVVRGYSIVPDDDCDYEYNDNMYYVVTTEAVSFFIPFTLLSVFNMRIYLKLKKRRIFGQKPAVTGENCSDASALPLGKKNRSNMNICISACRPLGKGNIKPIQNINENDPNPICSVEVRTYEMQNTSTRNEPQVTLLVQAPPLNDHAAPELVDGQNAVCFSQLLHPSFRSAELNKQMVAQVEGSVAPHNELQTSSKFKCNKAANSVLFSQSFAGSSVVASSIYMPCSGQSNHEVPHVKPARYKLKRRVGMLLVLLSLALVVFWLPYSVTNVIVITCNSCINEDLFQIFVWMLWIKSCVNPFLYAYNSPRFRHNFQQLLCRVLPARLRKIKPIPSMISVSATQYASRYPD